MRTVDLRYMDSLENVFFFRPLDDTPKTSDVIDEQWLYRCGLIQLQKDVGRCEREAHLSSPRST